MHPETALEYPGNMVFDWNHVAIGSIAAAHHDPRTHDVVGIVVRLSGEASRRAHVPGPFVEIPVRMVYSIRPGEVTLDRSLEALVRQVPELPAA